jgi:hypothetical protein
MNQGGSHSGGGSDNGSSDGAYYAAKDAITNQLKAPSTASFSSDPKITDLGNGEYQISTYVDAQNSFGAKIRSNVTATVKYQGGQYQVENSTIGDGG